MTTPEKPVLQTSVGCLIAAGLLAVALIAAALIIAGAVQNTGTSVTHSLESANPANVVATVLAQRTPTIVVRPPVVREVQALADLTTVSTLLSTIVDVQQARVGDVIYEKLILIACGRVKAGVDLSKLREQDVTTSADGITVTVQLPKAELLDAYLIDDSTQPCTTRVYDRTNLLLIPQTKDLESQAREQAIKAIREMALQSGILGEADGNARTIIERVLMLAGYQKVVVVSGSGPAAK
ncbi:MAG TPA: DUF4230 domain-containing protein [Anaerolineae bacterium]|jgi:hypothetical protein